MKVFYKIKAQAMQLVLLVAVVVAIILSAFLGITHVHSFFALKSEALLTASETSHALVRETLRATQRMNDTVTRSETSQTLTKTYTAYYGAWTKAYSAVQLKTQKIQKVALGGTSHTPQTPNLYITAPYSPVVVVGNTRLEGNCYFPKEGIKAGTIAGTYYQGSRLYHGRAYESRSELPKLAPEWITYLKGMAEGISLHHFTQVPIQNSATNSFYSPTKLIYSPDLIVLDQHQLMGNLVVYSATKVVITASAKLLDVMVIAPQIQVQDNVQGRMQLIATKTMHIGKACHFSYPSSLILWDRSSQSHSASNISIIETPMTIGKQSRVAGAIVYLNPKPETTKATTLQTHMRFEKDVQLTGEVYCEGTVQFQGILQGSLYAKQCVTYDSGSVYLNHLYNVKILENPIPEYAGLPFETTSQTLAKWLY